MFRRKAARKEAIVEPTVYQTIDVVPLKGLESEFDYGVDIINRGNSFITSNDNILELRKVHFKDIKAGTYHRYGDVLLRQRDDDLEGKQSDNFILQHKRLRNDIRSVIDKVHELPLIRQRIRSVARKHDYDPGEPLSARTVRKLQKSIQTIGDRILDDRGVRQYYFDRTKVSVIQKPSRVLHSQEERLDLIRQISNEVIEKYFSIVRKSKPKTRLDQMALDRMKEVEKQKEVEQFIKQQLQSFQNDEDPMAQLGSPQLRRFQLKRRQNQKKNSGRGSPSGKDKSFQPDGRGIQRVMEVQSELMNQVGEPYKPKVRHQFDRILNIMCRR